MSLEDRFEIGSPIHIGQIATAYPARQKSPARKVLLKIIHPQFAVDDELVKRFEREGQAMAQIDHPNVVKVYQQGREEDLSYLVLEWVGGGTLADKIKEGPLDQERIKKLSADILAGLEAVHQNGLIHRDLKPDNILICQNGSARLGDFSLSGFGSTSGLTEHGAIVGTPAFLAPELTGGDPANFLDVGGAASIETVKNGFKIILKDTNVKAILINIFGGIVRCDRVARGVVQAVKELELDVPVVVRLEGTNAIEAKDILNNSGVEIIPATTMQDAADKVVSALLN